MPRFHYPSLTPRESMSVLDFCRFGDGAVLRRQLGQSRGSANTVSLLHGTLLSRLGHPEHWLGFAQRLINGESVVDLQRRTGICSPACKLWQVRFMQMLDQQGHTDLAQWITWLRSRQAKEVNDFVRDGGQLESVAGSLYSAGSKRRFAVPPSTPGSAK